MATSPRNPIQALREAAAAESTQEARPVMELFARAELWVEETERGFVQIAEDGWVYAYTDQAMLPGGQLVGFGGGEGLAVDARMITGDRLRYLVGPDVGIVVDHGYTSECRIQVPAIAPVTRTDDVTTDHVSNGD